MAANTIDKIWEKANDEVFDVLFNLYVRWQDEREYEDINDYLKVIQKYVPEATKMSKKPFGFTAKAVDGTIKVYVKKDGNYLQMVAKVTRKA